MKQAVLVWIAVFISVSVLAGWHKEAIDGSAIGLESDVTIDSTGRLHILTHDLGNETLVYLQETPTGWLREAVPNTERAGLLCQITVDNLGFAHVCYFDEEQEALMYSYRDSLRWHTDQVIGQLHLPRDHADITLDASENPHIFFINPDNNTLNHTWYDDSWHGEILHPGCDSAGKIVIASQNSDVIKAATWCDATKEIVLIELNQGNVSFVNTGLVTESISNRLVYVTDSQENPHLLFDTVNGGMIKNIQYSHQDSNNQWHHQTVCQPSLESQIGLILDNQNQPHVIYSSTSNHAINAGGIINDLWSFRTIGYGLDCFISWSNDLNKARAVFSDISCNNMYSATQQADHSWTCVSIGNPGAVGRGASMDIDSNNQLFISYLDETGFLLKVASKNTADEWTKSILPVTGHMDQDTCLVIDAIDTAHLSYYNKDNSTLNYTRFSPTSFHSEEVIHVNVNEGLFELDLAVDLYGQPHSLYSSYPAMPLFNKGSYIVKKNNTWDYTHMDFDDASNHDLVVGSDKTVHMVYSSGIVSPEIKYAQITNGEMITEIIASDSSFKDPVITMDNRHVLHIAYSDLTNQSLIYGKRENDSWIFSPVNVNPQIIHEKDISVDSNGIIHICYSVNEDIYNENDDLDLYYATGNDTNWRVACVDNRGNAGRYCSIVVDSDNKPHMSYFNGHLKYAIPYDAISQAPPTPTPQPTCNTLGCSIILSQNAVKPGDLFSVNLQICNPDSNPIRNCPVLCALEVMGEFFLAPSYTDFDHYRLTLLHGEQYLEIIPEFIWPDGCGSLSDLRWHAALTRHDYSEILGQMDTVTFSYSE